MVFPKALENRLFLLKTIFSLKQQNTLKLKHGGHILALLEGHYGKSGCSGHFPFLEQEWTSFGSLSFYGTLFWESVPKCFPTSLGSLKFHSETHDWAWQSPASASLRGCLSAVFLASRFLHVSTYLAISRQFWEILVGFNILIFCIFFLFLFAVSIMDPSGSGAEGMGRWAACLLSAEQGSARFCPVHAVPWEDRFGGPKPRIHSTSAGLLPRGLSSHPDQAEESPPAAALHRCPWIRRLCHPAAST